MDQQEAQRRLYRFGPNVAMFVTGTQSEAWLCLMRVISLRSRPADCWFRWQVGNDKAEGG